ncbi:MAG: rhomboid family intramembrane serine protease [Prevotella sp.]|nr:rhomboid family intramembrane serine protease [Prevotella sp.]
MFDNSSSAGRFNLPPATKNIIIINVIVWLVEVLVPNFSTTMIKHLGLHYVESSLFNPIQIITYAFLHDPHNIMHILFNMFTLWMFGRTLEMVWGTKRFVLFYMVCAVGAAIVQEGVWALTWQDDYIKAIATGNQITFDHAKTLVMQGVANHDAALIDAMKHYTGMYVTVGASGAIYGLLLGFAFIFPNLPLYLFFIPVPIKAKYMVIGYAVLEFFLGVGGRMDTIAHFAHLGGMIFGLALLLYWKKKGTLRRY